MKKKIKAFKDYECDTKDLKDNYYVMTKSMVLNENYLSLTNSSKILYSYMKLWSIGKEKFTFSYSLASQFIKNRKTIYNSLNELEEKGFIEVISKSRQVGYGTKYKLSSKWKSIKK